jgi:hypothetical protein
MQNVKNVLGWILDSQRLMVSRSDEKHCLWSVEIRHRLEKGSLRSKELETLVGRMEHVGYLTPFMKHFLGRLHRFKDTIVSKGLRYRRFRAKIKDDLHTHKSFLDQARQGISMNLLIH